MAKTAVFPHVIDLDTIEDSEPEREAVRAPDSSSSNNVAVHRSALVSKAQTADDFTRQPATRQALSAYASDSDIEIVLPTGPQAAQCRYATPYTRHDSPRAPEQRSNFGVVGYTSAADLLKEGDRRKKAHPILVHSQGDFEKPASAVFHSEGWQREKGSCGPDMGFDDEIIQLPLPLTSKVASEADAESVSFPAGPDLPSDTESPASLFRKNISKFKAPSDAITTSKSFLTSTASRRPYLSHGPPHSEASSMPRSKSITSSPPPKASTSVSRNIALTAQMTLPTPYLALITTCPVCSEAWTTIKTANKKLSHIRKCASARGYLERTVLELTEAQVRRLYMEAEEQGRKVERERTLFESTVSRKGKEVSVVGVEKRKNRISVSTGEGSDIENRPAVLAAAKRKITEAVLLTQGGTAHSQASADQVQKEVDARIKMNKKISRGNSLAVLQPNNSLSSRLAFVDGDRDGGGGAKIIMKDSLAPAGVGNSSWKKATALLTKSKAARQTSLATKGDSVELSRSEEGTTAIRTGKLENYQTSRFRLAEKAQQIAAAHTVHLAAAIITNRATGRLTRIESDSSGSIDSSDLEPCPHASWRMSGLSKPFIHQAASLARDLPYNLWSLAGSATDPIPDRIVVSLRSISRSRV